MGVISDGTTMIDNGAFENLDVLSWDTTAKTGNFTAVAGNGYFVNTTSAAITVTLPAGSAGDSIGISDYSGTFATNACTVDPNGSEKVNGGPAGNPAILRTTGLAVILIYVDGTIGWKSISDTTNNVSGNIFTVATGGTIATVGDYKVHTFTSSGTFEITQAGTGPNSTVDYLVVAGGGGGGAPIGGGGGGAGGYRLSAGTYSGPARAGSSLSASVASFPITVGAGGGVNSPRAATGDDGGNSIFQQSHQPVEVEEVLQVPHLQETLEDLEEDQELVLQQHLQEIVHQQALFKDLTAEPLQVIMMPEEVLVAEAVLKSDVQEAVTKTVETVKKIVLQEALLQEAVAVAEELEQIDQEPEALEVLEAAVMDQLDHFLE